MQCPKLLFNSSPSSSLSLLLCQLLLTLILIHHPCQSLHSEGIWSPSSRLLKVIARFGIQKSDPHHKEDTYGYSYGNITLLNHHHQTDSFKSKHLLDNSLIYNNAVMLIVNRTLFKRIYHIYSEANQNLTFNHNSSDKNDDIKNSFCKNIYHLIRKDFYDEKCNNDSKRMDFVRYVPCHAGRLCNDPFQKESLPNYQFTYVIDNPKEPTFWFLLLISCQRDFVKTNHSNATLNCDWTASSNVKSILSYDTWFVNGHPNSASNKPIDFDHQFSFEQQNLIVYIVLNICYVVLLILQLYALSFQKIRNLNYLFTISLSLHCLSYFFICLHKIVFAHNGKGFETLYTIADVMKIMSTALFILFVLIIAKGWPITKPEIFSKTMLVIIWSIYTFIKILLFIWIKDSLNIIEEVDEYHTIPGWISLGFRIILMLWFLHELRHTMMLEQDSRKLKFYLHFGAGMLVWFVHLPLVAMIAMQIDLMWRYKIITGFSSAADVFAYAIVTRLMWQTKQNHFLAHESELDFNEELEYYDDNSISHSETYKFSKANYRSKHSYDNHIDCDINTIKA